MPHASWPKKQNIKQKLCCNKFNKDFKNDPHPKKKKIQNNEAISLISCQHRLTQFCSCTYYKLYLSLKQIHLQDLLIQIYFTTTKNFPFNTESVPNMYFKYDTAWQFLRGVWNIYIHVLSQQSIFLFILLISLSPIFLYSLEN